MKNIDSSIAQDFFEKISPLEKAIMWAVKGKKMTKEDLIEKLNTNYNRVTKVISNVESKARGEADMFSAATNREEAVRNYLTTGRYHTKSQDKYRNALQKEE